MKVNHKGILNARPWEEAGIALPKYDWDAMRAATEQEPVWVHFGAGNIFRGFIAGLQQRLLNRGLARSGVLAAETFDYGIIEQIYKPHDNMTLMVGLRPDGGMEMEVVASIARGIKADSGDRAEWDALKRVFTAPSLQMVSFTITEKGYALDNLRGERLPVVKEDLEKGPESARHAMSVITALMLARYEAGAAPVALVSMDNCSHNGEKLRASVLSVARGWLENGFVPDGFVPYLEDETRVSFPWTMIDKITPRPSEAVEKRLAELGVEDMRAIVTDKKTYIAPFVNAEKPQYLVVEDRFPNGRPRLEQAGVYMADRETVNQTERMKVTACLNPLHTALAVFGCLLGYNSIAAEMRDPELKALVERIGCDEGLPVVEDPGIFRPSDFIREVIDERLPNPFIPDTPQRIATDTSQKIPIRFGETIKAYLSRPEMDASALTFIPLALAGWLRYLLAVDDAGNAMPVSPDPMLDQLQETLRGVCVGEPESARGRLKPLLSNPALFGVDLYQAGLGGRVEEMVSAMLAGSGAVRATLRRYLS